MMDDDSLKQSGQEPMSACPKAGCLGRPSPGDVYCRVCGTSLGSERGLVRRIVGETLTERLTDRSLIELDLAQMVRNRLISGAKTYLFILGVPLAILSITLATVGITSFNEFNNRFKTTTIQLEENGRKALAALEKEAATISAKAQQLTKDYIAQEDALAEFRKRLPALDQTAVEVANLQKRVDAIEIFGIKARPLSGEEKLKVERAMELYDLHLQGLGLKVEKKPNVYSIEPEGEDYRFTFYDPVGKRIALGVDWDVYRLLVMYGFYALPSANASSNLPSANASSNLPSANASKNIYSSILLGSLSDYLARSYLTKLDHESVTKWSKFKDTDHNLGELLVNLDQLGSQQMFEVRWLFTEALIDAEAVIGATELGRLIVSTWRRTSVPSPAQKPNEAVRGFVDQLQVNAKVAAALGVAFAKVGLVAPAEVRESSN